LDILQEKKTLTQRKGWGKKNFGGKRVQPFPSKMGLIKCQTGHSEVLKVSISKSPEKRSEKRWIKVTGKEKALQSKTIFEN